MMNRKATRIAQAGGIRQFLLPALLICGLSAQQGVQADATERERFKAAWTAASRGDHDTFKQLRAGLADYPLYPYLAYEDFRHRRAQVQPAEMQEFLAAHSDWAFSRGLRLAWLKTLGKRNAWQALLDYGESATDTVVRCYRARAQIQTGQLDGLLQEAQDLWAVGKSQPSECDPVFEWLKDQGGITPALAWERVRLAMMAGNPRLTLYLARFLPAPDREWLQRWQQLSQNRYRDLPNARSWPDESLSRMITSISLRRLALSDASLAWEAFNELDGHFSWTDTERGAALREIALQSAVALADITPQVMQALPVEFQDDQILQWWARQLLVSGDWRTLDEVITRMPPETRRDSRWRYWQAIAKERLGDGGAALSMRQQLAGESNYYGFLAADHLGWPYSICPLEPGVSEQDIQALASRPGIARALELRAVGLDNWALAEWSLAVARLDSAELKVAAALARGEDWHDRVIFLLGDSGDLQFYDWRFPLVWEKEVAEEAARNQLDPAWVHGVMRSESALAEAARSSAGALGLMQVTPATASRLSRHHGLPYRGWSELTQAAPNIRFGTRFMRELLDRYDQNPVLVSGAYNAGPNAVDRWLDTRPKGNADAWIEAIPYYETRDYIPRVLAFTAIYEWRMANQVTRVSSKMPNLDSGAVRPPETTEVVCVNPT
jgi:soluble lytic murein transglycosylase